MSHKKGATAVYVRLRPRSVLSSFGVVLMSCKANFHVVRSALQNSMCTLYIFADQVFLRSYVLRHIRLRSFAVEMSISRKKVRARVTLDGTICAKIRIFCFCDGINAIAGGSQIRSTTPIMVPDIML